MTRFKRGKMEFLKSRLACTINKNQKSTFELSIFELYKTFLTKSNSFFSGMICQLFANLKRKKRGTYEILAGGGRFDSLISSFASRLNIVDQDRSNISPPCGVGMSIGLGTISSHVFTNSVNANIRFFFWKFYLFTFLMR